MRWPEKHKDYAQAPSPETNRGSPAEALQKENVLTSANHPVVSVLMRALCSLVLLIPLGCDHRDDSIAVTEIAYDFEADREFPPGSDREFLPQFEFTASGITVRATAADEDSMAVDVSRRGPGGLGVVGNGGLEPDGDTTLGPRINNGEWLVLEILDALGSPVSAQLVGVSFNNIKQFPDHPETRFEIIADNDGAFVVRIEGTLDADSDEFVGSVDDDGNVLIDIEVVGLFGDTFIFTNGRPFHEIANRFRVGGITVMVEE